MNRRSLTIVGAVLAALVVAVIAVVVITSGGGDDESAIATPEAGAPVLGAPSQELEDCLAEQGVEVPSGGAPDPSQQPSGDQTDAFEACSEFLPEGAPGGGFPAVPGG